MSSWLHILLGLSAAAQAAILGAGVLEAVSYVPNWRDPQSLAAYRTFARHRHPGYFYQVVAPVTTVLLAVVLVFSLTGNGRPVLAAIALASVVAAEVFTLLYFFPRNKLLFFSPLEPTPGQASRMLVRQWERANILRLLLQIPGVAATLTALATV